LRRDHELEDRIENGGRRGQDSRTEQRIDEIPPEHQYLKNAPMPPAVFNRAAASPRTCSIAARCASAKPTASSIKSAPIASPCAYTNSRTLLSFSASRVVDAPITACRPFAAAGISTSV